MRSITSRTHTNLWCRAWLVCAYELMRGRHHVAVVLCVNMLCDKFVTFMFVTRVAQHLIIIDVVHQMRVRAARQNMIPVSARLAPGAGIGRTRGRPIRAGRPKPQSPPGVISRWRRSRPRAVELTRLGPCRPHRDPMLGVPQTRQGLRATEAPPERIAQTPGSPATSGKTDGKPDGARGGRLHRGGTDLPADAPTPTARGCGSGPKRAKAHSGAAGISVAPLGVTVKLQTPDQTQTPDAGCAPTTRSVKCGSDQRESPRYQGEHETGGILWSQCR